MAMPSPKVSCVHLLLSMGANMMMLALESQQAAQLRLCRLGLGGVAAIDEATLMVSEKVQAFGDAYASVMSGEATDTVIGDYRAVVQANIRRLTQAG